MFGINKELRIHFVGIGGIGMSGIAQVLLNLGYPVSGSDMSENENTAKLKDLGAHVFEGHREENIDGVQIVVYSSAINHRNPEIMRAKELGLPLIKRAEMLAELMRLKYGIAVAGSHGKTTTTSFLSTILQALNYSPTFIIGGVVDNLGGHAKIGESELIVAEADESDGSFLLLSPIMSVITNVDDDHLDYYKTSEKIKEAFVEFANRVPFYGCVGINANDKNSCDLIGLIQRPIVSFGIKEEHCYTDRVDYLVSDITYSETGSKFKVSHKDESVWADICFTGKHNVLNSLGAMMMAHKLGASLSDIAIATREFKGVKRRFEKVYDSHLVVVDDYAHHPTEIRATIETANNKYPNKKLVVVFEPHRFTRTKQFWNEFVDSFLFVDEVYIAPIYAASEEEIPYIDSQVMVKNINEKEGNSHFLESWDGFKSILDKYKDTNTVILTLGAGAISKKVREQIAQWDC